MVVTPGHFCFPRKAKSSRRSRKDSKDKKDGKDKDKSGKKDKKNKKDSKQRDDSDSDQGDELPQHFGMVSWGVANVSEFQWVLKDLQRANNYCYYWM